MKVVQSRNQGFIHRLSSVVPSLVVMCLTLAGLPFFGLDMPEQFFQYYLVGLFAIPVLVTIWLLLFNSGSAKIDEYSFSIANENLVFRGLSGSGFIPISDYKGYALKGWWPKTLLIFGSENDIKISETVFSPAQINQIKRALDELR